MMQHLQDLDYANDIALLSSTWVEVQDKIDRLSRNGEGTGMKINISKTKVLRLIVKTHRR